MWSENIFNTAGTKTRQRLQVRLDQSVLRSFSDVFSLIKKDNITSPLILNSPHSGRDYPENFLAQTRLSLRELRQSEDCYVDRIVQPLTEFGIPVLAAKFPRIYLDVNRSADEWAPESLPRQKIGNAAITPRARAGLGVVPVRIGLDVNIYPHPVRGDLVQGRLDVLYHPYHQALQGLVHSARQQFGRCLLLDCHSMPGHDVHGQSRPDIVLGTCHGDSCKPETIDFMEIAFTDMGYKVVRNHPYAGGFITTHYGRPDKNCETVQIEINKDLYLDAETLEPHAGMAKLMADMQVVILQIENYLDVPTSLAAE